MKTYVIGLASLAVALSVDSLPAVANDNDAAYQSQGQSSNPAMRKLPQPMQQGDITYLTGGIAATSSARLPSTTRYAIAHAMPNAKDFPYRRSIMIKPSLAR